MPMPEIRTIYRDDPTCAEIFVDGSQLYTDESGMMRAEFCLHRLDSSSPPENPVVYRVPVCRLIMPMHVAAMLRDQLLEMVHKGRFPPGSTNPPPVVKHGKEPQT